MPTVLVTGAGRGIGLALATVYAGQGWEVIATCRAPERAGELAALVAEAAAGPLSVQPLDVTSDASIAALAAALRGRPIDLLINNAGIAVAREGGRSIDQLTTIEPAAWEAILRTNVIGPFLVTRALLANLRDGERRQVAMLSSVMGSIARNTGGYYAYRSSKAALNMVTSCLARDLEAEGITVAAFHPGWVRTAMGGAQAPLDPLASARHLQARIAELSPRRTGTFINHDGAALPW